MLIQIFPYPASPEGGSGDIVPVGYKSNNHGGTGSPVVISLTDLSGTITAPIEGDFVIVSMGSEAPGTNYDMSVTGYTEHCDLFNTRANLGVFSKRMTASPDTSITVNATTSDRITHVYVLVLRGVNAATPMDVAVVTATGTSSGAIPAITPVTAGAIVVGTKFVINTNPLDALSMTNPISYDPFLPQKQSGAVSCLGSKEWAGSGAVGPANVGGQGGGGSWCAAALAIRPA